MSKPTSPDEQPELLPGLVRATIKESQAKARATRARKVAEAAITDVEPVARVLVDVALPHLDRTFDYAVPEAMAEVAVPGARVKVRFAGQQVDGIILERAAASDHAGSLAPLRRVVSAEPVLTPQVATLAAAVASRYAGVRSDVLRLAVPPRHATTEKQPSTGASATTAWTRAAAEAAWSEHEHGSAFVGHLADGGVPRAVWSAPPGADWPTLLAHAAGATLAAGRGVLIAVPDVKDVARLDAALTGVLGPGHHVTLTADAGPAARYRDFLAVARGAVRVVVGTRSSAFAPVRDLGLVVVWDDGDDLHAEPRAPYPHTREVLLLRAELEGTAAIIGAAARSVEADQLVRSGWAHELAVPRARLRDLVTVSVAGASEHEQLRDPHGSGARVPRQVHHMIKTALAHGPVLVQTPRSGYALALACERCRTPARCAACAGPLALTGRTTPPQCRWCGTDAVGWRCELCDAAGLRAPVLGDQRTAEELGRSFPATRVVTSSGDRVLATVTSDPAIVVATPGAEPVAVGGYAAVVLLDPWLMLGLDGHRADEEALRRWTNAVALVRSGGTAMIGGEPAHPAVQALVRWDHPGFAARLVAERTEAHLPPACRLATVSGAPGAVDDATTLLAAPDGLEVLGPMPIGQAARRRGGGTSEHAEERVVLRVPRSRGVALSEALGEMQRVRSARKLDAVRVQVDPVVL